MADSLPPAQASPPTKLTVLISGSGTNLQALIDASTAGLLPSTTIVRVISNKKGVQGLTRAEKAGIPTAYHNLIFGKYLKSGEKDPSIIQKARAAYDADLADIVLQDKPDLVVCAGWMHILAPSFLEPLADAQVPVINLHPAIPGKASSPHHTTHYVYSAHDSQYSGANAIKRSWDDFQKWEAEQRERRQQVENDMKEYETNRQDELEHTRTGVMLHFLIAEVDRGEPILVEYVDFKSGETLEELTERIHEVEHLIIVKGTGLAIVRLWDERRKRSLGQ
jgi:phosphoribosylglycinamide formyltransferase